MTKVGGLASGDEEVGSAAGHSREKPGTREYKNSNLLRLKEGWVELIYKRYYSRIG